MAPLKEKAGGAAPPNREEEETLGAPPVLRDPNNELFPFWPKLKLMPAGIGAAELSPGAVALPSLSLLKENTGAVVVELAALEEGGGGVLTACFSTGSSALLLLSEPPSTTTAAPVTAPVPPLPPYFLSMLARCFS